MATAFERFVVERDEDEQKVALESRYQSW